MTSFACLTKKTFFSFCLLLLMNTVYSQYNTVVDLNGTGNFKTIQSAIDAAPTAQTTPYVIFIKKGKYHEVVTIPSTKPFIQLIGESMAETIISYDNYSGKPNPSGGTFGTSTSATVNIAASDCMVMNLSMENATGYGIDANAIPVPATGDGPQALALNVSADRVVFFNCRFNGGQDTVFTGGPAKRNYFKNCYIDGNTDFIFGDATVIFDSCIIYPRTRLDNSAGGYVTAVNTKAVSGYGYVFRDCKLTKNRGYTNYTLGRPWQSGSGGVFNKTVFLNTAMGSNISAVGWSVFDVNTTPATVFYGEYNSRHYDGTSVDMANRISWSHQITAVDAAIYYNNDSVFMNANTPQMPTWNPVAAWPVIAAKPFVPELSVSNLLARKIAGQTNITWNITFPMSGITCDLYKSKDGVNYSKISTQISTEDTACNFNYIDSLPAAGSNFYYLVKASKQGFTSITSDTGIISSTPTLFAYGVLGNVLQGVDAPSATQVYQISGINLTNNVIITPPVPFEVSIDNGVTWYTHANPLVIVATGATISNLNIYLRMNGTTPGTYVDSIYHSTIGGATVPLRVKGTMLSIPLLHDSFILTEWPLTTSTADSAAVRVAGIVPTMPVFSSMLGASTLAGTPAFSASGEAFANNPAIGKWSVNAALNRNCYYQFSVVADADHQIRIDTLLLNASFLGSANGTLAIVYSKTGFTQDSSDITSGIGTTGLGLSATNYGAYAHPAKLAKISGNNDSTLRFLSDSSLIIQPKDSLTFRLYFGLGSTNSPRFAYLKNVMVKGHASVITLPLRLLTFNGNCKQGTTTLLWTTSNELDAASFNVEKSRNGVDFTVLTSVPTRNKAGVNSYSAVDNELAKGSVFYRLKMIDKDGKMVYSKVIKIDTDNYNSQGGIRLYPNPVKNELSIDFNGVSTNVDASILSLSGKEFMRVSLQKGLLSKTINVALLPQGAYLLVIKGKLGEVSTFKFKK